MYPGWRTWLAPSCSWAGDGLTSGMVPAWYQLRVAAGCRVRVGTSWDVARRIDGTVDAGQPCTDPIVSVILMHDLPRTKAGTSVINIPSPTCITLPHPVCYSSTGLLW